MKIKVHYSLALLFFVFIFTGFYLEFFIFFLVIFAHELGHYVVAKIYGLKIEHLTFTVLGGILKIEDANISGLKQILLYAAGIIVNLLLLFGSRYLPIPYLKKLLFNYNLLLIVFNLLPIYPLDGFQILQAILGFFKSPFREFRLASTTSYLFLGALFVIVFINRWGLAAWIILVYLLYQNINFSINKNNYVLKKIINNYRFETAKYKNL